MTNSNTEKTDFIRISGISENNLKNIDVQIPRNQLTVITGLSGSGKSSLAFDVLYRESQRRMFSAFSSSSRQLTSKLRMPHAEQFEGLSASLAVGQGRVHPDDRATFGTFTGLYDKLRLIFARAGTFQNGEKAHLSRSHFSFNHPKGQCEKCRGLGKTEYIDQKKIIADGQKTIRNGAFVMTTPSGYIVYSQVTMDVLNEVCNAHGFSVDIPWDEMTEEQKNVVLFGSNRLKVPFGKHTLESRMKWTGIKAKPREEAYYPGIITTMEDILRRDRNTNILRFVSARPCDECKGKRLLKESLSVLFKGQNIAQLSEMDLSGLHSFFLKCRQEAENDLILSLTNDMLKSLQSLLDLGLAHRKISDALESCTHSELQRMRLSQQMISGLSGMIYVLDEPSAGVHPFENEKIIRQLLKLRNLGNTIVVVEHNLQNMLNADYLIDLGPGGGTNGGELLFQGSIREAINNKQYTSPSLEYLRKAAEKPLQTSKKFETIPLSKAGFDIRQNGVNLMTAENGAHLLQKIRKLISEPDLKDMFGDKIFLVNQKPIGRSPRSNPATYSGLFDLVRKLFSKLDDAKNRKLSASSFSFNTKGGRCEVCQGAGLIETGMHFLENSYQMCPVCRGKRFRDEVLEVKYSGKNIGEILEMSMDEAREHFSEEPKIRKYLDLMQKLGLGYIHLGQAATQLSGGEAQRLKLASELIRNEKKARLFLLEFPCTGLHVKDIEQLIAALRKLSASEATFIIAENNMEMLARADYIIELQDDRFYCAHPAGMMEIPQSITAEIFRKRAEHDFRIEIQPPEETADFIEMKGITTHNLQQLDVQIPLNKITAISGPSGSGKSSLAFDTILAEGRFRYLSNFSSYVRSRVSNIKKGDFESCEHMIPAIGIGRSAMRANARSRVATLSGIYELLRLLYSRIGRDGEEQCTLTASDFSFNSDLGACPYCGGLGFSPKADVEKLISHPDKSIYGGAISGNKNAAYFGDPNGQHMAILKAVENEKGLDLGKPWNELGKECRDIIMLGCGAEEFEVNWVFQRDKRSGEHQFRSSWPGLLHFIDAEWELRKNGRQAASIEKLLTNVDCGHCRAFGLKADSMRFKVGGMDIAEMCALENEEVLKKVRLWIANNSVPHHPAGDFQIVRKLLLMLVQKLEDVQRAGLAYLPLSRRSNSLSDGERQRLRIASIAGGNLQNMLYVLDEPTAALHPDDACNVIELVKSIKKQSNTVLLVEHHMEMLAQADYLIDMGPKGGQKGGRIMAQGSPEDIAKQNISPTAPWLSLQYEMPKLRKDEAFDGKWLHFEGANANNLKNMEAKFPMQKLSLICGLSGSGKTTLLRDVVLASMQKDKAVHCAKAEFPINPVIIDSFGQSFVGQGIVASAALLYDDIRALFASQAEAKKHRLKKTDFSIFAKGGRCEACKGQGQIEVKLDFLPDAGIICESCQGKRFNENVLKVKIKGKSIADVLEMSVHEALELFVGHQKLAQKLAVIANAGLDYIILGQKTVSLSSGEQHRLRLCNALSGKDKKPGFVILDEPSRSLHPEDVQELIAVFKELSLQGHTIIITDHHPLLFQAADYLLELGPGGGSRGGDLVRSGFVQYE